MNLFNPGDIVEIRSTGEQAVIRKIGHEINGVRYYYVLSAGKSRLMKESDLRYYADITDDISAALDEKNFGTADEFREYVYYHRFAELSDTNLYSYQGNKILFNPFQYKPLLKFLGVDSDERLLIADEVGVGKTIESGIILDELIARQEIQDRDFILIVCPNILTQKWKRELKEKFGMDDFVIHDGKSLAFLLNEIKEKGRPNNVHSIVGEQLFRNARYVNGLREALEEQGKPFIKILIIDECHHYRNPDTETHKLGILLSSCTEKMLMLSATPFNLRKNDLFNQLHMLNPAMFPDSQLFGVLSKDVRNVNRAITLLREFSSDNRFELQELIRNLLQSSAQNEYICDALSEVLSAISSAEKLAPKDVVHFEKTLNMLNPLASSFTRTLKRDALEHRVTREVKTLEVRMSPQEESIYRSFIDANLLRHRLRGVSPVAFGLITNGLERIAASSIPALKDNIERYMSVNLEESEDPTALDEVDEKSRETLVQVLREQYKVLLRSLTGLDGKDSKYEAFLRLIQMIQEMEPENPRIMVFSFYIGTLKYLRRKLTKDGYRVALIYGDTPYDTPNSGKDNEGFKILGRNDVMEGFKKGDFEILLASEVGGEGLDFQFCSALINYDLPYNPMRIEQRIGRIDRMGQMADKIVIGNLCMADTVDTVINAVLLSRIAEAQDMIGDLEPIIAEQMTEINQLIINKEFTQEDLEKRIHELNLRIEEERITREEFDKERYELVNDKGFRDEFEESVRNCHISPQDSLRFTMVFLKGVNGCWAKKMTETSCRIHLSRDMRDKLSSYYRRKKLGSASYEIYELSKNGEDILVDFNGCNAFDNSEVLFLKPSGPWIHFILDYLALEEEKLEGRIYTASVKKNEEYGLEAGIYAVFFFEYKYSGFYDRSATHYIMIDMKENKVVIPSAECWDWILRNLVNSNDDFNLNKEIFEELSSFAEVEAMNDSERIEKEYTGLNAVKINARIKALRELSEIRIQRYQNDMIGASLKEQERLQKAIQKDQNRTEEKIHILEGKMQSSVSTSMQGMLLLDVI